MFLVSCINTCSPKGTYIDSNCEHQVNSSYVCLPFWIFVCDFLFVGEVELRTFIPEDYTKVIVVTLPSKLKVSKYVACHFLCISSSEHEIERLNACRKIIRKCSHNIMAGHKVN